MKCSVEGCDRKSRSLGMCTKHYHAVYRETHPAYVAKRNAYHRELYRTKDHQEKIVEYRSTHLDERKEYDRLRYQKNKESIKARVRQHAIDNAEQIRSKVARYYTMNADIIKKRVSEWNKANPERRRMSKAASRKRERSADGCHDYEQLRTLLRKQRGCCAVCKVPLHGKYHKDHIVPLVSGGTNWIENIQFLCPPCNMQKNRKDPIEFMQQRGFLL